MKKVTQSFLLVLSLLAMLAPADSFGEFCSSCGIAPPIGGVTAVNVGVSVVRAPIVAVPVGSHGFYGGGYGFGYGNGFRRAYGSCAVRRCHHRCCGYCRHRCCGRRRFRSFALNIGFGSFGFGGGFGFNLGLRSVSF